MDGGWQAEAPNQMSYNGCHLRRAPEPNRGEGACGWSGAPQRRGTPSLSRTK